MISLFERKSVFSGVNVTEADIDKNGGFAGETGTYVYKKIPELLNEKST